MESDNNSIIARLQAFCKQHHIDTNNVLAITIQKNRTTEYTSLIVNFENGSLLTHYPVDALVKYKEIQIGDFLVCYQDNLPIVEFSKSGQTFIETNSYPFCCKNIFPYKPRHLDKEQVFQDLLERKGTNGYIYEIKTQVDGGEMLWTKYFKLQDGKVNEVQGPFSQKVHAFKNYKCPEHKWFFGIDLYSETKQHNFHHMRLNPFQQINISVLQDFFTAAKVE